MKKQITEMVKSTKDPTLKLSLTMIIDYVASIEEDLKKVKLKYLELQQKVGASKGGSSDNGPSIG